MSIMDTYISDEFLGKKARELRDHGLLNGDLTLTDKAKDSLLEYLFLLNQDHLLAREKVKREERMAEREEWKAEWSK